MIFQGHKLKKLFREYLITSSILCIISIAFIVTFLGGFNNKILISLGAYYKPLILARQWFRFITPIFLHASVMHFITNAFSIYIFCPPLEKFLGKLKFLLLFILSGIGGHVFCFVFSSINTLVVGASSSIFGMFGVFIYLIRSGKMPLDSISKRMITELVVFNLIMTFVNAQVSISGHIGGFVSGFLLAFLLIR